MDDQTKRAEQLLEERARARRGNGQATPAEQPAADAPASSAEELTNDLKRLAADFANYRKRNEAERADFARYAKSELIVRLLDVLDGYDRAMDAVPAELRDAPWVEGMWLVERKLRTVLEAEGLQAIGSLGKPFDPYVHEAVAHVVSDEPEGTVVGELQKGYRLHERVIRPALVSVSKGRDGHDAGSQAGAPADAGGRGPRGGDGE